MSMTSTLAARSRPTASFLTARWNCSSKSLREGSIVVEAGANVGAHTLFLARKVGPTGFVFAMEPQRIVFQTLCGNLALNSITNVAALHVAVGSAAGRIIVPRLDYATANNFGGLGLGRYEQGEAVGVITIDSLGLDRCHLIKADVEGMEEEVLRGAEQTIARCRPILVRRVGSRRKTPVTGAIHRFPGIRDVLAFASGVQSATTTTVKPRTCSPGLCRGTFSA